MNSPATRLVLYVHSKTVAYCSRYHLLTPRNGARKIRTPVQIPSIVLMCASRTPSPSRSKAQVVCGPLWRTGTCPRPSDGSPAYAPQASVYTSAPGTVDAVTNPSNDDAHIRLASFNRSFLPPRPTAPNSGGRSLS